MFTQDRQRLNKPRVKPIAPFDFANRRAKSVVQPAWSCQVVTPSNMIRRVATTSDYSPRLIIKNVAIQMLLQLHEAQIPITSHTLLASF